MWVVKEAFSDVKDNGHAYSVGDEYPRKGYEPSQDRLRELSSCSNRLGVSLIEVVEEKPEVKPKRGRKKKAE